MGVQPHIIYFFSLFYMCLTIWKIYLLNKWMNMNDYKIKSKMLLISNGRTLRRKTYATRKLWILRLIRIYFHLNGLLELSHLWSSVLTEREWSDRPSDSLWVTRTKESLALQGLTFHFTASGWVQAFFCYQYIDSTSSIDCPVPL